MPTYTVHAPTPKSGETTSAPERFVFVRDGFHGWAFLVAPLWLSWRGLWLALLGYGALIAVLSVGLYLLGAATAVTLFAIVLVSLLIGFESSTLQRWTLARRGFKAIGFVVGDDRESAERRFFVNWVARMAEPARSSAEPSSGAITRREPVTDVIGLFPESGVRP